MTNASLKPLKTRPVGPTGSVSTILPPAARFSLVVIEPRNLSPQAIDSWHDLEERSCHRNPFLSPEFVLPAVERLGRKAVRLVVVHRDGSGEWLGLAVLRPGMVTPEIPLPHARSEDHLYSFRSGLLIDAEQVAAVLDALFERMPDIPGMRHGLELQGLRLDSVLAREMQASVARLGYSWKIERPRDVPAVFPDIVTAESLERRWSASMRKQLRRSRKFLEQYGPVEMRLIVAPAEIPAALENFLRLERNSWKGDEGTACTSNPVHELFIREMVAGMAERGRVLITELRAGDRVAAAAINLVSGGRLFAFKIGWDSELAKGSPGLLHEAELLGQVTGRLRNLTLMDSCATETSYIAGVWPDRIPVATGIVCFTKWARLTRRVYDAGRRVKHWVEGWRRFPAKQPAE